MKKVFVEAGQSLVDISIQEYGRIDDLVKLCVDNGLELDADIIAGQKLLIDTNAIVAKDIVNYYQQNNIKVNSRNE